MKRYPTFWTKFKLLYRLLRTYFHPKGVIMVAQTVHGTVYNTGDERALHLFVEAIGEDRRGKPRGDCPCGNAACPKPKAS